MGKSKIYIYIRSVDAIYLETLKLDIFTLSMKLGIKVPEN